MFITRSAILASIALSAAVAAPAHANFKPVSSSARQAVGKLPTNNLRYCLQYEVTGSRIVRTACQSQKEWAAEGIDAPALAARAR